jgi:cell division protein FtsB
MTRARRVGRALGLLTGTVLVVGVLLFGVFPTRTYLAQRTSTSGAEERLAALTEQNEALAARAAALDDDAEIERLAREQYNLVMPGEEAYAVLPPPLAPIDLPAVWPFGELGDSPPPSDPATTAEG